MVFYEKAVVPALNAHSLSGQPQGIAPTIKEQQWEREDYQAVPSEMRSHIDLRYKRLLQREKAGMRGIKYFSSSSIFI